jgi:hypothetical protein
MYKINTFFSHHGNNLFIRVAIGFAIAGLLASCGGGGGGAGGGAPNNTSVQIQPIVDPTDPVVVTPPSPGIVAAKLGAWSNPATWGGKVPADGDIVNIPEGKVITLDVATASLAGLQIDGSLQADGKDIAITSRWIMVKGMLSIGTPSAPFTRKATITLLGANKTENLQALPGVGIGTKMVGVVPGGKLQLFGEKRMSWSKLDGTLTPGATKMILIDDAVSSPKKQRR